MSLLHINGFTSDGSTASLAARYPTGANFLGSPEFRAEGFNGGECIRVRDTQTLLVLDPQAGIVPTSPRLVVGCRIRANGPARGQALFAVYNGQNGVAQGIQFKIIVGKQSQTSSDFKLLLVDSVDRVLGETDYLSADEWLRLEFRADVSTPANSSFELRIDGITELKLTAPNLKNPQLAVGWNALWIGLKAETLSNYIDFDDLYVCDGSPGSGGNPYQDFIGDVTVDTITPLFEFPIAPGLGFTAGGSAANVVQGVNDGVSGVFNGDTAYAEASLPVAASQFVFLTPYRTHQSVFALSISLNAKVTVGSAVPLLRYFIVNNTIFLSTFDIFTNTSAYRVRSGIAGNNPATGAPWTPEEITTIIFGIAKTDGAVSTIRVSEFTVEVLVGADPVVSRQPLPTNDDGSLDVYPFPLFKPNWRDGISMVTSYLTSVTTGRETNREERRVLASRPVRALRATLTSLYPEFTRDLIIKLMKRSLRPTTPVPLWQDEMTITSASLTAAGTGVITVEDTRFRRLFRGMRLVVLSRTNTRPSGQDTRTFLYYGLDAWSRTELIVDAGPSGPPILRAGDKIYPCFDSQLRFSGRLSFIDDEKAQAIGDESIEIQAASSLPGVITSRNSAQFVIFGGGATGSSELAPIWPFKLDWSSSQNLSVERKGRTIPLGKSVYLDTFGTRPVLRFTAPMRFTSREGFWNWLKFFDLVRARGSWFWFPIPTDWWTIDTAQSGGNILTIQVESFQNDAARLFPQIFNEIGLLLEGLAPTRLGYQRHTFFKVLSAVDLPGGKVQLTLNGSVNISLAFAPRLRLAAKMRLRSDEFTEVWSTLSQCDVAVEVESLEDVEDVEITNITYREDTVDVPSSIEDLFFYFDVNTNVFSYDFNSLTYVQAQEWPSPKRWYPHLWFDARFKLPPRFQTPSGRLSVTGFPLPFLRQATVEEDVTGPRLLRYLTTPYFGNQRGIVNAQFRWGGSLGFSGFPVGARVPWDNKNGMTLFVAMLDPRTYATANTTTDAPLFKIVSPTGTLFEWYPFNAPGQSLNGRIRMFRSPGQVAGAVTLILPPRGHNTLPFFEQRRAIAVFRWKPSVAAQTQAWWSGIPSLTVTASASPQTIATGTDLANSTFSSYLASGPTTTGYVSGLGEEESNGYTGELDRSLNREGRGVLHGMLGYKRALTNAEINEVANFLADTYGLEWNDI